MHTENFPTCTVFHHVIVARFLIIGLITTYEVFAEI